VANKEQLVSFVAITIITIVLMSLLAYSTVLGAEGENNISFLEAEGNALMDKVGTWFGYLFWFSGRPRCSPPPWASSTTPPAGRRRAQGQLPARQQHLVREPHLLPAGLGAGRLERDHPADHPVAAADPPDRLRFLLTVIIALVIWMLLAGLAALLGFL
jgi:hypothetical protein